MAFAPFPIRLWRWAINRGLRPGAMGPTLSQAAVYFGKTMAEIEEAVEEYDGEGYLGIGAALRTTTGGVYTLPRRDRIIEAY